MVLDERFIKTERVFNMEKFINKIKEFTVIGGVGGVGVSDCFHSCARIRCHAKVVSEGKVVRLVFFVSALII